MVAVTVNALLSSYMPGVEVVNITANDGETYTVQKIGEIQGAFFQPNRDNAVTDSWGVTFTAGGQTATIELKGTTTVTGTLILFNS